MGSVCQAWGLASELNMAQEPTHGLGVRRQPLPCSQLDGLSALDRAFGIQTWLDPRQGWAGPSKALLPAACCLTTTAAKATPAGAIPWLLPMLGVRSIMGEKGSSF